MIKLRTSRNLFRHALCAVGAITLAIGLSFAHNSFAQRATEEEMDRATRPLGEYLKDIRANYKAIDGLVLKRGTADTEDVVARLEKERLAAKSSLDKAIYGYLLARAHYWRGFHEFKATRNKEVFAGLRPKVFAEFLAAFKGINSGEDAPVVTDQVRRDIIGGFASALATNLWGGNLSPEEKQQAVVEFVDVVEKMPDRENLLPAGKTLVRMYRNLGIEGRLADLIPGITQRL